VIVQAAATAATLLVTAAVSRELRIGPCEKESEKRELRRVATESDGGRRRESHGQDSSIATFYSGKAAAKFAKTCFFR
jgi:hypothetical protein